MTKPIHLFICLFLIILDFSTIKAQKNDNVGQIYYKTDSTLLLFDKKTNHVDIIFRLSGENKIIDYATNWKQGIIVLVHNPTHSILFQLNGINNKPDTLLTLFRSDGEGYKSISEIDISPTGDFMVMKMTYWEWHGIKLYDFRNHSILDYVGDKKYLTHFIKWLPFNSILVTQGYGSEIDGPGDLIIYNYNLENNMNKSWKIPMTIYEGFYDSWNGVAVICYPNNDTTRNIKGIRLNQNDLYELKDTSNNKQIKANSNDIDYEISIYKICDSTFNLKVVNSKTKSIISNEKYPITYSEFDRFDFYSLEFGTDTNIVVKFYVSKYINKNAWANYGSVLYFISLKGKLLYKTYDNIQEYRTGFNIEKYEHIFKQDKVIVNKYVNNKYIESFERKDFDSPIPNKINIE